MHSKIKQSNNIEDMDEKREKIKNTSRNINRAEENIYSLV